MYPVAGDVRVGTGIPSQSNLSGMDLRDGGGKKNEGRKKNKMEKSEIFFHRN